MKRLTEAIASPQFIYQNLFKYSDIVIIHMRFRLFQCMMLREVFGMTQATLIDVSYVIYQFK